MILNRVVSLNSWIKYKVKVFIPLGRSRALSVCHTDETHPQMCKVESISSITWYLVSLASHMKALQVLTLVIHTNLGQVFVGREVVSQTNPAPHAMQRVHVAFGGLFVSPVEKVGLSNASVPLSSTPSFVHA